MKNSAKTIVAIIAVLIGLFIAMNLVKFVMALLWFVIPIALIGGGVYIVYCISTGKKILPGTKRYPLP